MPALRQFPLGRLHLVGLRGKKHTTWWCAIGGERYDWKQSNRLLVVQTGDSIDQAKVFKEHAVPQGLCAHLINALKLIANQQGDREFKKKILNAPLRLDTWTGAWEH